ncbi:MAG: DUF1311 domain-containing protein [Caulobacteraceae bacterium]|nr:DUF1311 domain-containing protein [Caulobacteraceae bacterium]
MTRARLALIATAFTALTAVTTDGFAQTFKPVRMDPRGEPYPETAASFDCAQASTRAETLICGDSGLAMSDRSTSEIYTVLLRRLSPEQRLGVRRSQRAWLQRRNACTDHACLWRAYDVRWRELSTMLDTRERVLRADVSRVGQCAATRIDWIGSRLTEVENEPPQGTSIMFENGVRQVSYDREASVLASRVGDEARVCLISIPSHCPAGDDRGRIYEATNLRTRLHWRLPDASHDCGGA